MSQGEWRARSELPEHYHIDTSTFITSAVPTWFPEFESYHACVVVHIDSQIFVELSL